MQRLEKETFLKLMEEQPYLLESLYCFDFCSGEKPVLTKVFQQKEEPYPVMQLKTSLPNCEVDVAAGDLETVLRNVRSKLQLRTAKTLLETWDTFVSEEVYVGTFGEVKTMLETNMVDEDCVLYPTVLILPSYSKEKKHWLQQKLLEYQDILTDQGYQVLGVFLYGSQNYQMDTLTFFFGRSGTFPPFMLKSDVDAVAVVLPTSADLVFNIPLEKTIEMKHGSVRVKDLRCFAQQLLKGNYSTLELLLTPYKITTGDYFTDLLKPDMVLDLLNFNIRQTLASTMGSYLNMQHQDVKNGKTLARMAHLLRFQSQFLNTDKRVFNCEDWLYALAGNKNFGQDKSEFETDPVMYELQKLKQMPKQDLSVEFETLCEKERELHQKFKAKYPHTNAAVLTDQQKAVKDRLAKWVEKVFLLSVLERRSLSAIADVLLGET